MLNWLLVAFGGAAGATARFGIGQAVTPRPPGAFPWTTFAINVGGSLLLGVVMAMTTGTEAGWRVRALLVIGFCGGFTTFSSFSLEALGLLQARAYASAFAYLVGSAGIGVAAVIAGSWIGARAGGP